MPSYLNHGLGVALVCTALIGCSESDGLAQNPVVTPTPVASTTTQVLQAARQPNDAAEPFAVNDGAFGFNDTAEDTLPQAVNSNP
jgi:hypothetical protein